MNSWSRASPTVVTAVSRLTITTSASANALRTPSSGFSPRSSSWRIGASPCTSPPNAMRIGAFATVADRAHRDPGRRELLPRARTASPNGAADSTSAGPSVARALPSRSPPRAARTRPRRGVSYSLEPTAATAEGARTRCLARGPQWHGISRPSPSSRHSSTGCASSSPRRSSRSSLFFDDMTDGQLAQAHRAAESSR